MFRGGFFGDHRRSGYLLVFLVAVLVFLPSLGHELVTDDPLVIGNARRIVRDQGFGGLLTSRFYVAVEDEGSQYYRPIVFLVLWIGGLLGGATAVALHALNIAVHALNAVLVCQALRALAVPPPTALAGALLFAVHPVHVEPVTTIAGIGDLLATALILGASATFGAAVRSERPHRPLPLAAGLALFFLASLTKEHSLLLPGVLAAGALILSPGESNRPARLLTLLRRTRWWWVGFIAAGAAALALRAASGVGWSAGGGPNRALLLQQPHLAGWVWLSYFEFLLLPVRLFPYHFFRGFDVLLAFAGSAFVLLALWAGIRPKTRRLATLAILWTLAFLFPASGFFHSGQLIAERYLYLPSIGFCLLACVALGPEARGAGGPPRRGLAVVTALLLALLAVKTVAYQGLWKDNATLSAGYRRVRYASATGSDAGAPATTAPKAGWGDADPRAMNDGAITMISEGKLDQAEHLLQMALKAEPGLWMAHANLGAVRSRQKRWAEAAQSFEQAAAINPDDPDIWSALGDCYRELGREEPTLAAYDRALRLNPAESAVRAQLVRALQQFGRADRAREELRRLRDTDPELGERLAAELGLASDRP